MKNRTILIVEDEQIQREVLQDLLEEENYIVYAAENVKDGIELVRQKTIDAIVTDYNLPDKTGIELLDNVKEINPNIPVIIITAFGSIDDAVSAIKKGAYDYLTKPINVNELLIILKRCIEHRNLVSENIRLKEELKEKYSFDGVVAASPNMQEVLNIAGRVAGSKATVLITGESGTGKEIIARAIHFGSKRKDSPFIAFNVAALSPTLIESEFFGHEKGAFTGADKHRDGRFLQAHTGTIFIDEIGDIPVELQAKLLRVLQENVIEHLGGSKPIDIDIRVIAATNKNIEKMISEGTFREDLYYRLNVVKLPIPPLRERKEDILPFCDLFIKRYSEENNSEINGFTREAFDALMKYDFPGNVRELENLIERAVVLARESKITLEDLPPHIFTTSNHLSSGSLSGLDSQVENLEKVLIQKELVKAGGNQSKAARVLEISERKLRYKITKYEIN